MALPDVDRFARISDCGRHRLCLIRSWDGLLPRVCFVMLNPSTADANSDDPTIRKCVGFAERLGFGSFVVANLFTFRATDPADLRRAGFPRHDQDDEALLDAASSSSMTICAWGAHARGLARPAEVLALLRGAGLGPRLRALALTEDGIPRHPLMLPYANQVVDLPGLGSR